MRVSSPASPATSTDSQTATRQTQPLDTDPEGRLIEAQFTALRYFALDGTDHDSHREQASMIRRYLIWRNTHRTDPLLRKIVRRAETIRRAKVA